MTTMRAWMVGGLLGLAMAAAQAVAIPSPVVSYGFNGTLAADQAGRPALVAVDPLHQNSFETAVVNGLSRSVYRWSGTADSAVHEAGLSLNTTGLLSDYQSYTVALNFEFSQAAQAGGGWRRIVDTQGQQSDNGFYVAPQNTLQVVRGTDGSDIDINDLAPGSTVFTTPGFHSVWLSVQGLGGGHQQVQAWLDGHLELPVTASRFGLDNVSNPDHLLVFFADNLAAGSQLEFANGRIASLALYDGAVSPQAVPEPQAVLMLSAGLAVLAWRRRKAPGVRNVTQQA